jgi:magnesium chelatase family protein
MISVEADVSDGLPQFSMVGDLASEVKEAQDRVRTALRNCGYQLQPRRITVNLAPADIRKQGTGFDLPIAIAVLASYGYLPQEQLEGVFLAGELGLDGSVQGLHGVLGMVLEAKRVGCHTCIVPQDNMREAAVVKGITVCGAADLKAVVNHLLRQEKLPQLAINIEEKFQQPVQEHQPDFADIKGQQIAKRAAEIAAAGMHNLLLSGPPGAGKTMIARRIPGILPPMTMEEALEVSQIHSVAGVLPSDGILTSRPFRMPHHTISPIALAGGGVNPRPGEISLAHRGVLYLDELPEFQKDTLEILRQPLEEGEVRISRNSGQFVFPADFMLVASRNPCKCGYFPDRRKCRCSEYEVRQYLHRISRPLLDRIDLYAEATPITYEDLIGAKTEEASAEIRARVLRAHRIQSERYRDSPFRFNSDLTASALERYCPLTLQLQKQLRQIYEQKQLTARSYHRMIKVARTIADLEGCEQISQSHLNEAVLYRPAELL